MLVLTAALHHLCLAPNLWQNGKQRQWCECRVVHSNSCWFSRRCFMTCALLPNLHTYSLSRELTIAVLRRLVLVIMVALHQSHLTLNLYGVAEDAEL
jgi:hypothetical protein